MEKSFTSEYPYVDEYGYTWIDSSGFLSEDQGPCFICKKPTFRVDIDFDGPFCDSNACNDEIAMDLNEQASS